MNKEDIIFEIENLSDYAFDAIIECFKDLYCNGAPLYLWNREHIENLLDKVIDV